MEHEAQRKLLTRIRGHVATIEQHLDSESKPNGLRLANGEIARLALAALAFVYPLAAGVEAHFAEEEGDGDSAQQLKAVLAAQEAVGREYLKSSRDDIAK